MNNHIKSKLGGLVLFDYDDLNCVEFNVVKLSTGQFNLIMDMGYIDIDNQDFPYEYGLSIRTTLYEDNLVDMTKHLQTYFEFAMFDQMEFIQDATCFDEEGEILYAFDWNDYLLDSPLDFSDTTTPTLN